MAYGPCTYSYTRLKAHDFTGIILRAAYVLAVMFFLFQLTDGAAHSKGQEGSPVYIETEMSSSAGIDNKETIPSALKETASEEPVDSIVRKAAEFSITYPENWDGLLFSIRVFNNGDYVNEPDYEILGYDGASVYFQTVAIPL